jgi:starvation-inducible outer membrane lipoprotein
MKKIIMGIIGIVVLVVALSGCVSSGNNGTGNNTTSVQSNIVPDNTPVVTQAPDGSGTLIGGLIINNANFDYKNVTITIIGLDANGNTVEQKNVLIAHIKAGDDADYDVTLPENSKIVSGDVKVINATPA